ncbi:hypothetical protein [Acidomonas methanolica]|uniref:hypothetical protein n=1 Tax=Acidomonas methanolica TaxID=437 RepID=UPI00211A1BCD|nr:hypothetical protein [Acidomonas methanolica]MCQ9154738.1 hypothetical protein [Acidomonas methanolica]
MSRVKNLALAMGAVAAALCGWSYLRLDFADRDTMLYVLIGRELVGQGVLPYGGVFDHKPVGLYMVYGVWDALYPFRAGEFTVLALVSIAGIAWIAARQGYSALGVAMGMILLGAPFQVLGGNSELVLLPLIFAGLTLVRYGRPFWGGVLGGLAAEVNYLAIPCLALPLLFLAAQDRRRIFPLLAGGMTGLALPLLPYLAHPATGAAYFALQWRYLHHYGAHDAERLHATVLVLVWALCIFLPGGVKRPDWVLRLWALGGLLACLASGRPFPHYVLLVLLPGLLAGLPRPHTAEGWTRGRVATFLPLAALALVGLVHDVRHNLRERAREAELHVGTLRKLVGKAPVLGIEVTPVPVVLAGLSPVGHFLFPGHVQRLFGVGAEGYYLDALARRPAFVLTDPDLCQERNWPRVCGVLTSSWRPVLRAEGDYGYRLYEARKPATGKPDP